MDKKQDEKELMKKVKKGDLAAFGELVEMYEKPLYYFIQSNVKDRDTALDLTHDTFMKVWRYKSSYTEQGKFKSWLFRIASNLIKNYMKKNKKNVPLFKEFEYEDKKQSNLEKKDMVDKVENALDRIPKKYRVAVILRDMEGKSYKEIADILDIATGTVKSRISRGRKMIRNIIKNETMEEV